MLIHPTNESFLTHIPGNASVIPTYSVCAVVLLWATAVFCGRVGAAEPLMEVRQDFAADPGWEHFNNRIENISPPLVRQDFGWSRTQHAGGATPGEIGGKVLRSRTPAFYAAKIGPFSFKDRLSASGRITLMPNPSFQNVYLGFFNAQRQGFRPWSSMVIRFAKGQRDTRLGKGESSSSVFIDYVTAKWEAGGRETELSIPADGSQHTWEFNYDPDARAGGVWPDGKLEKVFATKEGTFAKYLTKAQQADPSLTTEKFRAQLEQVRELGLIKLWSRRGVELVETLRQANGRGLITVRLDDGPTYKRYLTPGHYDSPCILDRFGIFNFQTPQGAASELYISELVLNGAKIDLQTDPGWDAQGNRAEYVEKDFAGRMSFGYSATNHAGQASGEIGGTFTHAEAPLFAFYGDEVGTLTLDDRLSFSGSIAYLKGETDAGMSFGFFNLKDKVPGPVPRDGIILRHALKMNITDNGNGWAFTPWACLSQIVTKGVGPMFYPDSNRRRFKLEYDPAGNGGLGRLEVTLDEHRAHLNLTAAQRASGATFDHFGLINSHCGGKMATVYFDDMTYSARRPENYQPKFHPQKVKEIQPR